MCTKTAEEILETTKVAKECIDLVSMIDTQIDHERRHFRKRTARTVVRTTIVNNSKFASVLAAAAAVHSAPATRLGTIWLRESCRMGLKSLWPATRAHCPVAIQINICAY